MAHVVLIVNPFASRVDEGALRSVEAALARAGKVETKLTERRGHATELAAAASSADAVVVFGQVPDGIEATGIDLAGGGNQDRRSAF